MRIEPASRVGTGFSVMPVMRSGRRYAIKLVELPPAKYVNTSGNLIFELGRFANLNSSQGGAGDKKADAVRDNRNAAAGTGDIIFQKSVSLQARKEAIQLLEELNLSIDEFTDKKVNLTGNNIDQFIAILRRLKSNRINFGNSSLIIIDSRGGNIDFRA